MWNGFVDRQEVYKIVVDGNGDFWASSPCDGELPQCYLSLKEAKDACLRKEAKKLKFHSTGTGTWKAGTYAHEYYIIIDDYGTFCASMSSDNKFISGVETFARAKEWCQRNYSKRI